VVETTRRALHAVAELILAGPQYRTSGTIRLVVTATGFRTVAAPNLRVDGVDLVDGDLRTPISGHTALELATVVGVEAGAPEGLYHDGSGAAPTDVLTVDPDDAALLRRCWSAGAEALDRLGTGETPILWPEHFDVGIFSLGTGYGVSPGDGFLAEPYAYVTPARVGAFWNAPFGAARPIRDLGKADADAILAYFTEGRDRAAVDPARP
jgi:hypothetical protein